MEYLGEEKFNGTMDAVTGTIYQNGKAVSYFSADHGVADKETNLLQLYGNVKVWAVEEVDDLGRKRGKAVMRCDKVDWLASRELVQASGGVTFETDAYTAGTFKELVVTPKMDAFGTPDQFPETRK